MRGGKCRVESRGNALTHSDCVSFPLAHGATVVITGHHRDRWISNNDHELLMALKYFVSIISKINKATR